MHITDLAVTPIAFDDPPLLNTFGVHEPLALRTIVQLNVGDDIVGLGEGHGGAIPQEAVPAVRDALLGLTVFTTTLIEQRIDQSLRRAAPQLDGAQRLLAVSAIEVASLDAQGKILGLPVSALLGGAVRESVDFSAYLFYKWGAHAGGEGDAWGPALDPDGIVAQAHRLVDDNGFRSIKLKGGVFPPDEEIAAIRALAAEFPGIPLRLDPNGAWSPATATRAAVQLEGLVEYLEDPVLGMAGMSDVSTRTSLPLATNMCVVQVEDVYEAVTTDAVQIVLSDHHYWGGLRRTMELAAVCRAMRLGVSMHSNSHLGISLAAMTHVAAAIPELAYACDTHYPWNRDDDIVLPGTLSFEGGALAVPTGPGLGVDIDHDLLQGLHERYVRAGRTTRDDTRYMRSVDPAFDPTPPRF